MEILKEDNCFVIRKGKDKVRLTMSEVERIWQKMNTLIRGRSKKKYKVAKKIV